MQEADWPIVTEAEEARLGRGPVDHRVRTAKAEVSVSGSSPVLKDYLDVLTAQRSLELDISG